MSIYSSLSSDAMALESYHKLHPDRVPKPIVEPELTVLQKVALLKMHQSTLARGIATRLMAISDSQDRPSWQDYAVLRDLGFAHKPDGARWHELTHTGAAKAHNLARDEARRLGVHVMIGGGNCSGMATWRCTGCDWSSYQRYSSNGERNAISSFGRHMEAVNEDRAHAPSIVADEAADTLAYLQRGECG